MMENQLNQVFLVKRISKFLSLSKKLGLEIEIIKKLESLISSYNGNLYIIPDISSVTALKSILFTPISRALVKTLSNAGAMGVKSTSSERNPN